MKHQAEESATFGLFHGSSHITAGGRRCLQTSPAGPSTAASDAAVCDCMRKCAGLPRGLLPLLCPGIDIVRARLDPGLGMSLDRDRCSSSAGRACSLEMTSPCVMDMSSPLSTAHMLGH